MDELKAKGGLHVDKTDDAATLTVILMLGNFPEKIYPGLFNVFSTGFSMPGAKYGSV